MLVALQLAAWKLMAERGKQINGVGSILDVWGKCLKNTSRDPKLSSEQQETRPGAEKPGHRCLTAALTRTMTRGQVVPVGGGTEET